MDKHSFDWVFWRRSPWWLEILYIGLIALPGLVMLAIILVGGE